MGRSNIGSSRRTQCDICRVPSMRRPRRACLDCSKRVCSVCRTGCCVAASTRTEKREAAQRAKQATEEAKSAEATTEPTAEELLEFIIANHVELKPVVIIATSKHREVLRWLAGYREVGGDGWQNIIRTQAEGKTPMEAVMNLQAGRCIVINGKLTKNYHHLTRTVPA